MNGKYSNSCAWKGWWHGHLFRLVVFEFAEFSQAAKRVNIVMLKTSKN